MKVTDAVPGLNSSARQSRAQITDAACQRATLGDSAGR